MANPFDQFDNAPQPSAVTIGTPDPYRVQDQQTQIAAQRSTTTKNNIDIENAPLDRENKQVNIQQGNASIQNQSFNQNQGLRQEYNNLPEVKNYSVALQSLGTALKAPDTPQGDLATIYAYAKAADPGSVVREGEMDMATATASLPEKYKADALRLTQGKRLPPEVRTGLIEAMRQSVAGMRQVYDQQRGRYEDIAHQNGQDPASVVGQPLYDAYRSSEEQYIKDHGGVPRDPYAPQSAVDAPPLATETQKGFDLQAPHDASKSADDFRNSLFGAMQQRQIKSVADMKAWADNYNQSHQTQYQIDLKSPETVQAIRAAVSGKKFNIQEPTPDISDVRGGQNTDGQDSVNAVIRGTLDTPSFGLLDKGVAAADTLFKGGPMDYNLDRQYAISDYDQQNHPWMRMGGQALGGALLPLGEENTLLSLSAKGAGYGGSYAAGSSRSMADVPGNALMGAAAGAAIPGIFAGAGKGISALRGAPKQVPALVDPATGALNQPLEAMSPGQRVASAEQFGIDLPADAAGGRSAAIIGKGLDIMPGSAGVMEDARRATEQQVAGAVNKVADKFGSARTLSEGGAEIQRGAKEYIDRADKVSDKLYNAIPIPENAGTALTNTRAALSSLTSRFQSNPKLATAMRDSKLDTYLEALTQKSDAVPTGLLDANGKAITRTVTHDGELSWKDLKDFRSRIGEMIGDFRFGEGHSTSDLRSLYAALSEDMRASASAQGPKHLAAFERANNFYRQKETLIDDSLSRILGAESKNTPERAAAAVRAMTKGGKSTGDLKTLAQIKGATVKSGAWDEIASTMIRLGGQPVDSAGRDFNPQTFVQWYADMAEPARQMLFKPELRKSLDDFVAVNQRLSKVNALRNTSQTAGSMTAAGTVGIIGGAAVDPMLGVKLMAVGAGNYAMAKAWTNPSFVRLITGYSKAVASGNPNAVSSQVGRLTKLATTNPELREGIEHILRKVANDNAMMGVAASQPDTKEQ